MAPVAASIALSVAPFGLEIHGVGGSLKAHDKRQKATDVQKHIRGRGQRDSVRPRGWHSPDEDPELVTVNVQ